MFRRKGSRINLKAQLTRLRTYFLYFHKLIKISGKNEKLIPFKKFFPHYNIFNRALDVITQFDAIKFVLTKTTAKQTALQFRTIFTHLYLLP